MAWCRGQVVLGILGGRADQLTVTVNIHTTTPPAADAGPGYVLGAGWVSPHTAAQLAGIAAHIRTLPEPGRVPDTGAYRFTGMQKAVIQGRDGHCRFPGCVVAADRCEHDHLVASPHTDPGSDGPTSVSNGIALCRTHHQLKTLGIWSVASADQAVTLQWTGPGGVTVSTVAAGPVSPATLGHPS